jgi:hypothetical protein
MAPQCQCGNLSDRVKAGVADSMPRRKHTIPQSYGDSELRTAPPHSGDLNELSRHAKPPHGEGQLTTIATMPWGVVHIGGTVATAREDGALARARTADGVVDLVDEVACAAHRGRREHVRAYTFGGSRCPPCSHRRRLAGRAQPLARLSRWGMWHMFRTGGQAGDCIGVGAGGLEDVSQVLRRRHRRMKERFLNVCQDLSALSARIDRDRVLARTHSVQNADESDGRRRRVKGPEALATHHG